MVANINKRKNLKPFLHLPFAEQSYRVTEGWYYSEEERSVHGFTDHGGIDFELPRGTPVLAAADGLAISSYYSRRLLKDKKQAFYKGKALSGGLGFFVQIYHPKIELFTAYGHLERGDPVVKFHKPRKLGGDFWPVGHKVTPDKLCQYRFATRVKAGQTIGYVGDSGIGWGYIDYPSRPDPVKNPTWDEVHLHFEVFTRVGSKKNKKYFDAYGIKDERKNYPDSFKKGTFLEEHGTILWVLGRNGLPKFFK